MARGQTGKVGRPRVLPADQWRRNQYIIALSVFLSLLGFTFVMPFLPLYVMHELGVTDVAQAAFWSGFALTLSPLMSALLAPLWGMAADRFGRKPMFARSLLSFSILMIGMSLITNVYQLLVIRALWGLLGGFGVLAIALVSLSCPRDQMSKAVGLVQAAHAASYAVGPALGGLLAERLGMRQSFYVPAVLYFVALLLTQLFYHELPDAIDGAKAAKAGGGFWHALGLPNFLPIVGVLFIAQFVDKSFGATLPLFVTALGTTGAAAASQSGFILSAGAVATGVAAAMVGRLATKRSPWRLMFISLAGGLVFVLPMAFASTTWEMLVLRASLGLLAGGTITLAYTLGGQALPPHGRTRAFGFLSSGAQLGGALGPLVSGLIVAIGIRGVFVFDALLYGLGLLAILSVRRRRPKREEDGTTAITGKSE